ncbi:MAG TPA: NUDIX domain-containing protein [Flavobacterium sp.]|nr:NUDIX domain-containing protein [Flavobacterium sp.]
MYKVFINNKPLILTDSIEKETDFKIFLLETADIQKIIKGFYQDKYNKAILYHPDESQLYKKFKEKITVNKAAGGLVLNAEGKMLFIHRNGKWDLPKGGVEKNEELPQTATREVEEETGARELEVERKLKKTYHVFKRNGEYRLKITHWYLMKTNYNGTLNPQTEEGIDKAVWLDKEQAEIALRNSYENIKSIFESEDILNAVTKSEIAD